MKKCQHPVYPNAYSVDTCDAPATHYTDDLKAVHFLCTEHEEEARLFNDFETDPVTP